MGEAIGALLQAANKLEISFSHQTAVLKTFPAIAPSKYFWPSLVEEVCEILAAILGIDPDSPIWAIIVWFVGEGYKVGVRKIPSKNERDGTRCAGGGALCNGRRGCDGR